MTEKRQQLADNLLQLRRLRLEEQGKEFANRLEGIKGAQDEGVLQKLLASMQMGTQSAQSGVGAAEGINAPLSMYLTRI